MALIAALVAAGPAMGEQIPGHKIVGPQVPGQTVVSDPVRSTGIRARVGLRSRLVIDSDGVRGGLLIGKRRGRHDRGRRLVVLPVRTRVVERVEPAPPVDWDRPKPVRVTRDAAENAPLVPEGSNRLIRARGTARPPDPVRLGLPLPPSVPHVTLDPRRFDLPQPPDGQIYARVRGGVWRIDADTRRVIARVAP